MLAQDEMGSTQAARDTYERMMFGEIPYLCTIPHVTPPIEDNSTAASPEEVQQELARASDHGWELLQGMQGNCLYYAGGWWVYSFCYNEGIKQFHPLPPGRGGVPLFPPQEDKSIESYTLGKFDSPVADAGASEPAASNLAAEAASSKDVTAVPQLQTRGETKFLVQKLEGGTTCDLTGRPRSIEIQFHCNPSSSDHINLIKETASCVYLMVVHTPRLCNDVAFQPPQQDQPNLVTCQEIVALEDVEGWKKWKAAAVEEQLQELRRQLEPDTATKPLIIGGVEVGAQKLVGGTPDRSISASKIVSAAGKFDEDGKYLATLAKSDGKDVRMMSDKDIDKLGLKAAKSKVAEYRKNIEDLAGNGVPWKLDLYSTARGWEFRMIIGSDEADADEGGGRNSPDAENEADDREEGTAEEYK